MNESTIMLLHNVIREMARREGRDPAIMGEKGVVICHEIMAKCKEGHLDTQSD